MGETFYTSRKFINRIGLIIAILAIILFISSCLLNVYVYTITPTATPTPSRTPTFTRTPQPSLTPSITPTPTVTATLEPVELTQTLVPPASIILLEAGLVEDGYLCTSQTTGEDTLIIKCDKQFAELEIKTEIRMGLDGELITNISVRPFNLELIQQTSQELTAIQQVIVNILPQWLAEQATPVLTATVEAVATEMEATATITAVVIPTETAVGETETAGTTTPEAAITPQAAETEFSNWLMSELPVLSPGESREVVIEGLIYRISATDSGLDLMIIIQNVINQE